MQSPPMDKRPTHSCMGRIPRRSWSSFGNESSGTSKKLRAKLDLRWRLGVYIGYSVTSNEYYLGLPNGNVVKSRSVTHVVPSGRWDSKSVLSVKGIPGKLTMSVEEEIDIESRFVMRTCRVMILKPSVRRYAGWRSEAYNSSHRRMPITHIL